jgi:predicted MFS family arabinose efflux permease
MRERLAVLRERPFRLLFCGQAVSLLGDGMVPVALAFAVLDLTGSATDLGIVLAARTLPLVAFLLAGGVWADRLPRRTVMVAADLARFAAHGAMAVLLITGTAEVWSLAALAAVTGLATAFFQPAITGIMPAVVSAERLQQANALRGLAMAAGEIAGPALAGALVLGAGAGWALAVDAATFGISAVFLARVPLPPHVAVAARSFVADLREGWDDFRSRTWLWTTVAAATLGNMLFAAYVVLGPLVADRELGGAGAWALIAASFGVGSLIGGAVMLRLDPARPMLVATFAVAFFTFPVALLAIPAPAGVTAIAGLFAGIGLMVANNLWETTTQRHVPPERLSRVSSYDWFGSLAMQPVGMLIWGPIGAAVGVSTALWIAFAIHLASVFALLAVREVRELPAYPLGAGQRFELLGAQQREQLAARPLRPHGRDAALLEVDPPAGEVVDDL